MANHQRPTSRDTKSHIVIGIVFGLVIGSMIAVGGLGFQAFEAYSTPPTPTPYPSVNVYPALPPANYAPAVAPGNPPTVQPIAPSSFYR